MIAFFVFVFCLFATYAVFLLVTRKKAAQRAKLEQRLAQVLDYRLDAKEQQVRLAKEDLLSEIPLLNEWLRRFQPATQLQRFIEQADLQITVMRLLMFAVLAGFLGMLAMSLFSSAWLVQLSVGLLAAAFPLFYVHRKRQQRLHKFLVDLPEALDLLGRSLAVGHSFSESLQIVSIEMPAPIGSEFHRTYEEQNLGLSIQYALQNLADRVPLLDLRICITAVQIQRETGGNLTEILDKVAATIRQRFQILEDLKTLTTSSRISAWLLCGIPILVAVTSTMLNPDYMSVMWHDPTGQKLLALALGLQILGMLTVRKILQIKI